MNNLYFVTFDSPATPAHTKIIEGVRRLGQQIPYAGGFFLWSDRDIFNLYNDLQMTGETTSVIVPVDTQSLIKADILSAQVQAFVTRKAQAA